MPDRIRKFRRSISIFLLFVAASILVSCADKPPLVDDPDGAKRKDGAIPWNKQEEWETNGGQMAGATDRR